MNRILKAGLSLLMLFTGAAAFAQSPIMLHSHNDYTQTAPFWQAWSQKVHSIEADVFLTDGGLLVGHDPENLSENLTFEALYVEPIVTVFERNGGHAWKDSEETLQLMVELKSDTERTLAAVCDLLSQRPDVFDPSVNPDAVRVVITGNVPAPEDFEKWPAFISFLPRKARVPTS